MKQILSLMQLQLRISRRDPAYLFTTLFLPAGLYWFFAVPESNSAYTATYLIGSFSAFSFYGVVFLQYAINTAQEKTSPWAQYLKTLPITWFQQIFARLGTSILLGATACLLIYGVGRVLTPTELSFAVFLKMVGRLTLGGLPFLLMGLLVGELFSAKAVVPVANFFHLVLSFAGGLWKPPEILPEALQVITPWLPTYHYGLLTWSLASEEILFGWSNFLYLVGFGAVMAVMLLVLARLRNSAGVRLTSQSSHNPL